MVKVLLTPDAQKQLSQIPGGMIRRINDVLTRLRSWPDVSGAKPLRRELAGSFRIRTGDWRILFRVKADVITVFGIDNRRDVYR